MRTYLSDLGCQVLNCRIFPTVKNSLLYQTLHLQLSRISPLSNFPSAKSPLSGLSTRGLHTHPFALVKVLTPSVGTQCQHLPTRLDVLVGANTQCWHPVSTPTNMSRRVGRCQHPDIWNNVNPGSQRFFKMDLISGYHQVELSRRP